MNKEIPEFPDYGDGGDFSGAHRSRKAFRLITVAIVLLTIGMVVSEDSLQHNHAERLYKKALTLSKDSSRVLLHGAIKEDAKNLDKPSAKYTQALAVRQESDVILSTYDDAQALDDKNAAFTIRHGSRLFILGQPEQALAKYQRAEILLDDNTQNLLPAYLQAAAVARKRDTSGEITEATGPISEAMVLVARTNNREGNLQFPRPFWFSDLPRTGMQYAMLQREIIDENCAPLYDLANVTEQAVITKIDKEQYQEAKTWIGHLQHLGERLVESSDPVGSLQSFAGITIQIQCIELTARIETKQSGAVSESTVERRVKLNQARDSLAEFESLRDNRVDEQSQLLRLPNLLAFGTVFFLALIWFIAWCLYRIFNLPKSVWTLKHGLFGRVVLIGTSVLYFAMLYSFDALGFFSADALGLASLVMWIWLGLGILVILLGFIYPATVLTDIEEASRKTGWTEDMDSVLHYARSAYRRAYVSLIGRYYGALLGGFIITLCFWIVGYSILHGLFPWQVNLLAEGFLSEEIDLVESVRKGL